MRIIVGAYTLYISSMLFWQIPFANIFYICHCCCSVTKLCPTLSRLHGLSPTRLLCLWDSPGKNTGAGCNFLLQGIFPTQESNSRLLHWQAASLPLSHQRSPSSTFRNSLLIMQQKMMYVEDHSGLSEKRWSVMEGSSNVEAPLTGTELRAEDRSMCQGK